MWILIISGTQRSVRRALLDLCLNYEGSLALIQIQQPARNITVFSTSSLPLAKRVRDGIKSHALAEGRINTVIEVK